MATRYEFPGAQGIGTTHTVSFSRVRFRRVRFHKHSSIGHSSNTDRSAAKLHHCAELLKKSSSVPWPKSLSRRLTVNTPGRSKSEALRFCVAPRVSASDIIMAKGSCLITGYVMLPPGFYTDRLTLPPSSAVLGTLALSLLSRFSKPATKS